MDVENVCFLVFAQQRRRGDEINDVGERAPGQIAAEDQPVNAVDPVVDDGVGGRR